jgi:excinuclease ABC subunit C
MGGVYMSLHEKVLNLPSSPGVYLMKDSLGGIIYVGKAKNLKRRVQSYFQNSNGHSPKIKKLVQHLKDFDYILTDTEFEAFMLECKLIKQIKPPYNRKMKNPLSFAYLVVSRSEGNRRIEITTKRDDSDGNLYFGPFTNIKTVEEAIFGIKTCFKILCSNPLNTGTPCLNSSLGLCIGMCVGGPAVDQYHLIMDRIIALLDGTDRSIIEEMTQMMQELAENFDFEKAAKYRDYIDAVTFLLNKEKVIEFTEENNNIVIIETLSDNMIKLFLIKRTAVLFSKIYAIENKDLDHLHTVLKELIISYFDSKISSFPTEVSREELDEAQIVYSYLKSNDCGSVIIPSKWLNSKSHVKLDKALNKLLK